METEWFLTVDPWQSYASRLLVTFVTHNPLSFAAGCGKSVLWYGVCGCFACSNSHCLLSSAIIKNIKHTRRTSSVLIAYYYFDFKDVAKRDVRGLLSSLLMQLADGSDRCRGALSELYATCGGGSEQPSEDALVQCVNEMLQLPGQLPVYIIVDALDECPNNTGSPSPRKKVLGFMGDLVEWKYANLYLCITSRPEQDIQSTLNPLTPTSRRVSLHEEGGQRQDINNYIRSFVRTDESMRRWREEDKGLVINTLTERVQGM
jgi:hypothetical protein